MPARTVDILSARLLRADRPRRRGALPGGLQVSMNSLKIGPTPITSGGYSRAN